MKNGGLGQKSGGRIEKLGLAEGNQNQTRTHKNRRQAAGTDRHRRASGKMKSRAAGLLRKENARGKTDHAREPETRADGMKLQKKMAINWNCSARQRVPAHLSRTKNGEPKHIRSLTETSTACEPRKNQDLERN
jgi:hypothetical protein